MRCLFVFLLILPCSAYAQSCDAPSQTADSQTDSEITSQTHSTPQSGTWVRSGLVLSYLQPPAPPVIDQQTVSMQMCEGCATGAIRHAPSAAMRQVLPDTPWSEEIRRLSSAAAVAEDYETAAAFVSDAQSRAQDLLQTNILRNLQVETALQFQNHDEAMALLAAYGAPDDLPGPLLSDRLFWSVYTTFDTASADTWRSEILPRLERAFNADASSYQVRVWRAIGWLRAEMWTQYQGCDDAVRSFSDIVLDTTAEAVCPLMLGHLSHTFERAFEMRSGAPPGTELAAWHSLADALLATLAGNTGLRDDLVSNLRQAGPSIACADRMAGALLELRDGLQ